MIKLFLLTLGLNASAMGMEQNPSCSSKDLSFPRDIRKISQQSITWLPRGNLHLEIGKNKGEEKKPGFKNSTKFKIYTPLNTSISSNLHSVSLYFDLNSQILPKDVTGILEFLKRFKNLKELSVDKEFFIDGRSFASRIDENIYEFEKRVLERFKFFLKSFMVKNFAGNVCDENANKILKFLPFGTTLSLGIAAEKSIFLLTKQHLRFAKRDPEFHIFKTLNLTLKKISFTEANFNNLKRLNICIPSPYEERYYSPFEKSRVYNNYAIGAKRFIDVLKEIPSNVEKVSLDFKLRCPESDPGIVYLDLTFDPIVNIIKVV